MSRKENIIYCNHCGKIICPEIAKDKTSFLAIKKEWGYFSNRKDGIIHGIDICESCYEEWVDSFEIPPEIVQITEFL